MFNLPRRRLAPLALIVAACTWGTVWYPFRLLEQVGLSGTQSSLLTYLVGLLGVLALRPFGPAPEEREDRGLLAVIGLTAGWTNLAYVLAVVQGEIMRVMLLFYLAPLWTVLFARLLLGEKAGGWGWLVIGMALAGAMTMLHDPGGGLPLPANTAEWLGLSAGFTFALSNVLARKLKHISARRRSVWIFAGVILITLVPAQPGLSGHLTGFGVLAWGLVLLTGAMLVLATYSVQYGLAHTPANRAIVILLTELVAAAVSSWILAGETMSGQEWLGGALIVSASLVSGKMEGWQNG